MDPSTITDVVILAQAAGGPRAAFQEIFGAFSVVCGIVAIGFIFGGKLGKLAITIVVWLAGSMMAYTPEEGLRRMGAGLSNIGIWLAERF